MDTMKKVRDLLSSSNQKTSVISKETGIPYTTLDSILKQNTKDIKFDTITKLAKYFNVTLDYFYEEIDEAVEMRNREVLTLYNSLSLPHQNESLTYMKYLKSIENNTEFSCDISTLKENSVPYILDDTPVKILGQTAAGKPIEYADECAFSNNICDVPKGADYALIVNGDSMEPNIKNGSIIYVHKQEEVENGTIAIIEIDGAVTCKKVYLEKEKNLLKLVSLNPKYEPMIIDKGNVRILGKVIL